MTKYLIRRLLEAIPLLLVVSVILFALMQSIGDPVATLGGRNPPRAEDRERLRRQWGLDQPVLVQYVYWLIGNDWQQIGTDDEGQPQYGTRRGILRGDLGISLMKRRPVVDVIAEALPNTLLLMLTSQVVIMVVGLSVGIFSALRQYSVWDNVFTTASFVAFSMPIFWLALMLLYVCGVQFKLWHDAWGFPIYFPVLPTIEFLTNPTPLLTAWHMVLPVTTISLGTIAVYSRYMRSIMLEVVSSDYIRTARAKGLENRRVIMVHALKNAALPLVTLVGLDLPGLLAGAVVTERIFTWPGMGQLFIEHLDRADFPVLMALLMFSAVAVVTFQLLTDMVYTWLDPRIRY